MSGKATVILSGKMTESEYTVVHNWVRRHLGEPKKCAICGTEDPTKRYDWANISGQYEYDLNDWRRLCRYCHKNEKHLGVCVYGHELSADNIYKYPDGHIECRICRRIHHRQEEERSRAMKGKEVNDAKAA